MTICQIVTAVILATKMDKSTGTMPAPAGKAVLAFICLFVAGMLLTSLLLCGHCYCVHVAVVYTLLLCARCSCMHIAVIMGSCKCGGMRYSCHRCCVVTGVSNYTVVCT